MGTIFGWIVFVAGGILVLLGITDPTRIALLFVGIAVWGVGGTITKIWMTADRIRAREAASRNMGPR